MSTTAPTFLQSTLLVSNREITVRLRSKAFLISTGILLLAVLASIVIGSIVSANAEPAKIAVQRSVINALPDLPQFARTDVDTRAEAEKLVRSGAVEAAIVSNSSVSKLGITVIARDSPPAAVVAAVSVTPDVVVLEPSKQNPLLIYIVSLGFGIVFFLSAVTFGSTIAQSVVEEKATRVVEILMSAIPVRTLLAGKVLGNSILAFGQIALIAILSGVGLLVTGQSALLGALGPSISWFIVFFAFGFVLLAALFAAAASLVSRQEDMASVTSPVTTLVMVPYLLVILFNDNPIVLGIMSYVPFSAPVGMPMRIFLGTAQWWEPLLSLAILLVSTAFVIVIGARIYENAVLRMGGRVKLREALAR
ncbi:ABC transporter permease [Frigoribacterium sp. CG_9.8]|uniref:ABC transporter permease n=1 Tax=Frigoribacterium sp. CG_9.8 TaxID=2787733 RepID=UPI0018CA718A|nr:ABC-2 type transport system permease protein [Frigoribacterium sp. CG_9.8]